MTVCGVNAVSVAGWGLWLAASVALVFDPDARGPSAFHDCPRSGTPPLRLVALVMYAAAILFNPWGTP